MATRVMTSRRWLAVASAGLLVLAIAVLYQWSTGTRIQELASLGYPGVFLVMLVSGSSTLFPVPGQASILAAGAVWNPVLVGIAAGLGNATGESVAYLACRAATSAFPDLKNARWIALLSSWLSRYGFFAILGIALIPNFIFDFIGIVAAAAGYPIRRFWLACALGNSVKYVAMAYLGKTAGSLFGLPS